MAESITPEKYYSEPTLVFSEIHDDIAIEIQHDDDSESSSSAPNSDFHGSHKNAEAMNDSRCSGYSRIAQEPRRDDVRSLVVHKNAEARNESRCSYADPQPPPLCIQIPFTQSDQCIKYKPIQINTFTCEDESSPVNTRTIASRRSRSKSFDEYSTHHTQPDHKRDLYDIHRTFSVSRFHYFPPVEPSSPNNGDSRKTHHPTNPSMELCMEFFWCFWCCFKVPLCRTKLESACFPPKTDTSKPTPLYDCIYTLVFSPQYQNSSHHLTRVQKLAVLVRLSFELYKTMIGSFLTIFTPQNCNNRICSLTENLIPKDNLEIAALAMNSFMAFILLCEYAVEFAREKILRMYFLTDPRLPVEKEYFTNLLGILDVSGASLRRRFRPIGKLFWLYRQIGIILLSVYVANIIISGAVIYKNYYDKSSLFGFTTNVLFIVLKIGKILKIAIHSTKIPYSAYIESPVAFNSIKSDYICEEIKTHYFNPANAGIPSNENTEYFARNPQYTRFLLDSMAECKDIA